MTSSLIYVLAIYALNYCVVIFLCIMFSRIFSASGFLFTVYSMMIILIAVEALHYLELWNKMFWLIMKIIDIIFIYDIFICCMIIVEINYYRIMFLFDGGFFVFTSKKDDFRDDFT